MNELWFFRLYTIPYSPQLNAIEMVLSQLKSLVVSEFVRNSERRKGLPRVIDEAMRRISLENIENYFGHQAKIGTQCLRGIELSPDTLYTEKLIMRLKKNRVNSMDKMRGLF